MAEVSVERLSWRQWSGFASTWESIHNQCPDASFFVSREWVDCWLATFGEDLNPDLLAFALEGQAIGCCLLVWRNEWVRGIPLRRVYLNCSGEDERDATCVEYNSLPAMPQHADRVARALMTYLRSRYWDELVLPGMTEDSALCKEEHLLRGGETSLRLSHYVDFFPIRGHGASFDSVLSANTRRQIRLTRRLYEQAGGACALRIAGSAQEAAEIFGRLADLHQAAWRSRGQPGVFASPRFMAFHRRLIRAAFDRNRILLMEASAGGETFGALYSFLYRGRVYFYQSGFRYAADGRLKPGLLTHYLAICHCLERPDLDQYDFLAGDAQYKRSLATASRPLRWAVVRRRTLPEFLFRGLRSVKRTYVQFLEKSRRQDQPPRRDRRTADLSVPEDETRRVVGGHGQ